MTLLQLPGGPVHVHRVDLDAGPPDAPALAEELVRVARMRDARHRRRLLASRIWLRVVLGEHLGVEAGTVRFAVADGGKPSIAGREDLHFSHSRSAGVGLIAVARGRVVGVDVEKIRSDFDHAGLAERFFSPAEAEALRNQAEPGRQDGFFGIWVRKEAVLKASGVGIGAGLSQVDVRGDTVAGRWSVQALDAGPGFAAALAVGRAGPVGDHPVAAVQADERSRTGAMASRGTTRRRRR